ncbi:MAG: penicillin-binding transpeptidase domain-containing protein, partial [Thermodesulfovibrionales bacterium]
ARMIATIVNGGYLVKFRLLKSDETRSINQQDKEDNPPNNVKPVVISDIKDNNGFQKINISSQTLNFVKDALTGVVNEPGGTGGAARLQHILVGGKTGTAQVISKAVETHKLPEKFRDHAWFVAFAPADRPEIAMAVFVEHGGHGGSAAAPIARIGIEKYLNGETSKNEATICGEVPISEGD